MSIATLPGRVDPGESGQGIGLKLLVGLGPVEDGMDLLHRDEGPSPHNTVMRDVSYHNLKKACSPSSKSTQALTIGGGRKDGLSVPWQGLHVPREVFNSGPAAEGTCIPMEDSSSAVGHMTSPKKEPSVMMGSASFDSAVLVCDRNREITNAMRKPATVERVSLPIPAAGDSDVRRLSKDEEYGLMCEGHYWMPGSLQPHFFQSS